MRTRIGLAAAMLAAVCASAASAAEVTSGVPVGERVTSYKATKCGGAEDGVSVGQSLCYT